MKTLCKTKLLLMLSTVLCFCSCVSKKEIFYFQNEQNYVQKQVQMVENTLQPNDILKIEVVTSVPEAAIPYSKDMIGGRFADNIDLMKLEGYVVTPNYTIEFPTLGNILVKNLSPKKLERLLKKRLVAEGHLVNPRINVRLLNSKVTVLGEVKVPGTFGLVEPQINILQVLGYAGDLTINGKREEVLMIREEDGQRKTAILDLTSIELLDSPYYFVKPNDVIVVKPNYAKLQSAGYLGTPTTLITIASIIISTLTLITN
jgi:polysaccharide export outer membrane protein